MQIPHEFTLAAVHEEQERIDQYLRDQYREVLKGHVRKAQDRYNETKKVGFQYELRMKESIKIMGCEGSF